MNNKNFAVGIFMALALTTFVAAVLWLTGKQGSESTVDYAMYFEKEVGGLMLGGPVFYLGVNVGTVTGMEIVPGNPMRVRVDANILEATPIDEGTFASLAFQGITGVAVIKLSADVGIHEPILKDSQTGHLMIPVRDAGFGALLAKAPGVVDKIDKVLTQVNEILGQENRDFINGMLSDLKKVTTALAEKDQVIGELPVLMKQAIIDLQSTLADVKGMVGKLEPDLKSTLVNLEQSTDDLAQMMDRLETWTADNDPEMSAFMGDGLGQVPALISEARATLREVAKLAKELREDPSKLIYKPNENAVELEQ